MSYYVRAKGAFRELPKAKRWTKIRSIEVDGRRMVIEIFHAGEKKQLALLGSHQANLEFAKGTFPKLKPTTWYDIRKELGYV